MNRRILIIVLAFTSTTSLFADEEAAWLEFRGKPGPSGWRCHVIHPDPNDHGPDGINLHDWDGDGDLDVFANAEEGKYSRLYFNPGKGKIRELWTEYIEFQHDKCEDSGIGDLDNDGNTDYIANGGRVYFNPGSSQVRNKDAWEEMILFKYERRVPRVFDIDGDGLNDLIVGAQEWYKQPAKNKHRAASWKKFIIGKNRWPMNCILTDVDGDGDKDLVVPDRGIEICWYENPGVENVTHQWQRRTIHQHTEPMFMLVADVNGDSRKDFVITGGSKGKHAKQLLILLRTNDSGNPEYDQVVLDQPGGLFPKGVAFADFDGNGQGEILVSPKGGDFWMARMDSRTKEWSAKIVRTPGADSRKKMDNTWLGDLDGDGDLDFLTTEENGGWGVIWFENPSKSQPQNESGEF